MSTQKHWNFCSPPQISRQWTPRRRSRRRRRPRRPDGCCCVAGPTMTCFSSRSGGKAGRSTRLERARGLGRLGLLKHHGDLGEQAALGAHQPELAQLDAELTLTALKVELLRRELPRRLGPCSFSFKNSVPRVLVFRADTRRSFTSSGFRNFPKMRVSRLECSDSWEATPSSKSRKKAFAVSWGSRHTDTRTAWGSP